MYAWGGPGTIRLLRTKYHDPQIHEESFLDLYTEKSLLQAKSVFELSDVWVSYSWGFSDSTEKEDREFIKKKLPTFQKLGLRTHAYVQGLNVVEKEFPSNDFYCEDMYGRRLPYSKGRRFICPNNPKVQQFLEKRISVAANENFDGVYLDNLLFGFPPAFIYSDFAPFFGCACIHCRQEFKRKYLYPLTFPLRSKQKLRDYLSFRSDSTEKFVANLSTIVHSNKKFFGINLYDPVQMNAELYFGYQLSKIQKYLDYLLIENHSLPSADGSNSHLQALIKSTKKPVFVLSYEKGIGFEPEYSQEDYDSIASEADILGYKPCYKVSEFTTKGRWHVLNFSKIRKIHIRKERMKQYDYTSSKLGSRPWYAGMLALCIDRMGIPLATLYFENNLLNRMGNFVYRRQIHTWKHYEF